MMYCHVLAFPLADKTSQDRFVPAPVPLHFESHVWGEITKQFDTRIDGYGCPVIQSGADD